MAHPIDHKVYELILLQIKPDKINDYMATMAFANTKRGQHGTRTLGAWLSEAGPTGLLIILTEHESFEAMQKANDGMLFDPETQEHFKHKLAMLNSWKAYVCKKPPLFDLKPIDGTAPVVIHKLVPRKFRLFAGQRHKQVVDAMSAKVSPEIVQHVAFLAPIVYDDYAMFSIFQLGKGKVGEAYDTLAAHVMDPTNWAAMAETEEAYCDHFNILARPIQEYISKMPK